MHAADAVVIPAAWPQYSEKARAVVEEMIGRGDVFGFGDHPAFDALEHWARTYFGKKHALLTGSGTAALHSAYGALGLGAGDEVLVPTYTFHATVTPLVAMGVVPVFYDCEPTSSAPSVEDLEARISSQTRAIVVSHMFGLMGDMSAIMVIADRHGLPVVEDASQAHGGYDMTGLAGTIGKIGCFSIGGQKMISGGMGGLLITDDDDVYERALVIGHAHERAIKHVRHESESFASADTGGGMNYRIHPVAAVLALDHAETLDQRIAMRGAQLEYLTSRMSAIPFFDPPEQAPGTSRGGWYGYKVLVDVDRVEGLDLDGIAARFNDAGLKIARPTTRPLHQTSLARHSRQEASAGGFPNAEALIERTLGFPDKHFHLAEWPVIESYANRVGVIAESIFVKAGDH